MTDIVIIGAGPAGLAAARAARAGGAQVTLLDAADDVGGQYWRHLPPERPADRENALHHGWSTFTRLRHQLETDPGCRVVHGAHVWAVEPAGTGGSSGGHAATVHALVGPADGARRDQLSLTPDALVLATGAHDRTLPFPGWDLPGVVTPGAAQALAKGERIAVGRRVVVAGSGPFLLPVAASLAQTGTRVVGVFEAARARTLATGWLSRGWRLARARGKAAELAGYVAGQVRHRIPYRTGSAVVRAHGTDQVTGVTVARLDADWRPIPGTERQIDADAVCVGHGFTPRLELAVAAGCELNTHLWADRFVAVDDAQLTTQPGVYAAGEITAIGGVDLALAEGTIAGHCAAGGHRADPALRRARRARDIHRDLASRIDAAHGIQPGWTGWLDDDTLVCRCEEVGYGQFRQVAAATQARGLRSVKMTTRAGLGICQGRICGRTVETLLRHHAPDSLPGDGASTDHRPIAVPIRLRELADPDP